MRLRDWLTFNVDRRFAFRGRTVDAQELCNHYSAYLDARIEVEGDQAFFTGINGRSETPFAEVIENMTSERSELGA